MGLWRWDDGPQIHYRSWNTYKNKYQLSLQACIQPWSRFHPSQTWKVQSRLKTCEQIKFTKRWHRPTWEEPPKNELPYPGGGYAYRVDIFSFAYSIPTTPAISYRYWCLSVHEFWKTRVKKINNNGTNHKKGGLTSDLRLLCGLLLVPAVTIHSTNGIGKRDWGLGRH